MPLAMMLLAEDSLKLESLVDESSVSCVLTTMAIIAANRCNTLRQNFPQSQKAKDYQEAARQLSMLASTLRHL